ncbi:extracellular catalytic domain type 1 short-chain-length polyhydroxyalkanoate depolymerase [Mycolicibacterium grossiae]|uniref:Esterase n=1 Tax=Mycolicibacterium grossiae TaxID=1552759 RepID=A0A1E8Q7C9_9MYCO|nr:PHB depolymerase family esterase [Mycolicibacterium grossiae]OFJ54488.1 esterase [Mycolicibacterium grossiae]QEM45847.1 esterase [Mycolicibacterium grossiae]
MPTLKTAARLCALVVPFLVAVAGIGPAAAVPGELPGAISHAGIQRTYLLHLPAGVDRPNGLVVNLHGAGQNGGIQMGVTNFNAIADRQGFAVVYPDGIDLSWADGRGASVPDRQGVDDVGFLSALIEQVSRDHGVPPGRVFVTGMSAGAFMASRLACDRADLVAAIAPVSGTLGSGVPCAPSRPVSVLQVHGTADPVVPFTGGPMVGRGGPSDVVAAPAAAQRWRDIDACPAPVTTSLGGGVTGSTSAGCAGGTAVSFVQIDGGGHVWPVGNYDASAAIGQFFAAHGR